MRVLKEEYNERSVVEWLIINLRLYHIEKFGEKCEVFIDNQLLKED